MDLIHLDTNYLIGATAQHPEVVQNLTRWIQSGKKLAVSSIVWAEFLNGPVNKNHHDLALHLIENRVHPFTRETAQISADLFNQVQRKRDLRFDSLIAAAALENQALFATLNMDDFRAFFPSGLQLVTS